MPTLQRGEGSFKLVNARLHDGGSHLTQPSWPSVRV